MFNDHPTPGSRARLALAVVGVLVLGIAVGRLTAPKGERRTSSGPGGVQVGFPATASGVRAAALEFTTARLRSPLLATRTRRAMLTRIGTDQFAIRAIREDDANDLSGLGQNTAQVRYLTVGLGTRLESLTDRRARVIVWAMRSLSGVVLPVASFTTQVVDLQRAGTDWQVVAMRDADRQAVPRVLQTGTKTATNTVLDGMTPASYGTP